MTEATPQTDAEWDAEMDQYLAPLRKLNPNDPIAIAQFLAIEMTTLRVGIEKCHADVAALAACVARIESRLP